MSDHKRRVQIKNHQSPELSREEDIKIIASRRIAKLVKQRGGLSTRGFDMEPFEVLRDMLRENVSPHIGGAPQLMKVYPSSNSAIFLRPLA